MAWQRRGRPRLIISPDGANGSLSVYQDARVYAGLFDGDGARLRDPGAIHLSGGRAAEVLVFDLRPNELPSH